MCISPGFLPVSQKSSTLICRHATLWYFLWDSKDSFEKYKLVLSRVAPLLLHHITDTLSHVTPMSVLERTISSELVRSKTPSRFRTMSHGIKEYVLGWFLPLMSTFYLSRWSHYAVVYEACDVGLWHFYSHSRDPRSTTPQRLRSITGFNKPTGQNTEGQAKISR